MIDKNNIDIKLRESLDYIRDNNNIIEQTSNYVWGKDIVLPNSEERYELETWAITLPYVEGQTDFNTLVDCFKYLVWSRDNPTMLNYNEEYSDYLCHQLCGWQWLADEQNKILRNDGRITIVKYAKILKKN